MISLCISGRPCAGASPVIYTPGSAPQPERTPHEEAQQKADLLDALEAEPDEEECRYNRVMADHVIHISEAEAASNFADVLARVRAGAEVVIESGKLPVAVIHAPAPPRRTISECIALLPEDSTAVMDADFAKDVESAIESHREPLEPPTWD